MWRVRSNFFKKGILSVSLFLPSVAYDRKEWQKLNRSQTLQNSTLFIYYLNIQPAVQPAVKCRQAVNGLRLLARDEETRAGERASEWVSWCDERSQGVHHSFMSSVDVRRLASGGCDHGPCWRRIRRPTWRASLTHSHLRQHICSLVSRCFSLGALKRPRNNSFAEKTTTQSYGGHQTSPIRCYPLVSHLVSRGTDSWSWRHPQNWKCIPAISQRRQRRTEWRPCATCNGKLVNIGCVVPEICLRTNSSLKTGTNRYTRSSQYSAPMPCGVKTRSSAIAERPRDAQWKLKPC